MLKYRNNGSPLTGDNFLESSKIKVGNKIGNVGGPEILLQCLF